MEILNLEWHPNCTTASRVMVILLNGWILPIGQSGQISYRICKLADSYPTEVERSVLNVSGRAPLEARHSEKDKGKTAIVLHQ